MCRADCFLMKLGSFNVCSEMLQMFATTDSSIRATKRLNKVIEKAGSVFFVEKKKGDAQQTS